ncbi:hypothetical protein AGDE_00424 [Angomonas deanei]|uniref:Uncharacterized protein n=1 Tax=Angomonas deanei TaxID=59799 RepID=A0A7G2CQU5_9TRYP|nr:hypothetical protein AGDE_00424 [Angomonas deanei]CAD2221354.1 hypothetical protein, conserved [Angomonas deanei]|eukprot:EPY43497.1 hypothetical protein AGDE_00424 [Angomonas deanei]
MSALRLAAKQIQRQATLQPRLSLPAGRTISLEEGRRLAKLVNDEEERIQTGATQLLDEALGSSVQLESDVSKRIILLRQKQNHAANITAALKFAKKQRKNSSIPAGDAEKLKTIAGKVLRKESGSGTETLKARRIRASGKDKASKRK